MVSRMSHATEHGFTVLELLILGVIAAILATLVAMTYSGVQVKNRNAARQANIDAIQSGLETYYAQASKYPSLAELNDPAWRHSNLKKLADGDIADPLWNDKNKACVNENGSVAFAAQPSEDCYAYQSTTTDGSVCEAAEVICTQYTLTTLFEGGEKYVKSSLN